MGHPPPAAQKRDLNLLRATLQVSGKQQATHVSSRGLQMSTCCSPHMSCVTLDGPVPASVLQSFCERFLN